MDIKAARFLGACIVGASVILAMVRSPHAKYQIVTSPGHVYVLDTASGKVWEKFAPPNEGATDQGFAEPK